ncbi:hypothetical protein MWN33_11395 [Starkeya koreensis]|uniref:Uncharacterized protein n=1 Tax=Ancylobacter koreensis TaxID=266121 RepID=A0ABT0DMX7_9HYPH|nr:hypothetical protein [Ancylobacter koreensis]MCK0208635.1 hypothetical protein [Ancylobacter koreensis]
MWFLALELWPYLLAALGIGLLTGWLSGCAPRRSKPVVQSAEETAP